MKITHSNTTRPSTIRLSAVRLSRVAACVSALAWLGCASSSQSTEPATAASESSAEEKSAGSEKTLEVALQPKSDSQLSGAATLSETAEGVKVVLTVENVAPGEHGAHVHENGDCSAPDAASAGSHYNPSSHPHALPASEPRHLGDLGNITVGADGKGTIEVVAVGANLKEGDPSSFLGRAIIVHEKQDDGGQPVGNAGGRIGCGVIQ
jgi:superoxide dismutase, Cu-Zn family